MDSTTELNNNVTALGDNMSRPLYQKNRQSSGKGLENFLGELELEVMEVIWEQETATVATVLETLNQTGKALAYTTVMTVMSRLAEKGWLVAEKQGRAFLYHPSYSRQEAEAQAVGGILRNLIADFGEVAVAQFVKELDDIAPEQLERLADLLQKLEQDDEQT